MAIHAQGQEWTTAGEKQEKAQWVEEHLLKRSSQVPFSFAYDGKPSWCQSMRTLWFLMNRCSLLTEGCRCLALVASLRHDRRPRRDILSTDQEETR